MRACSGAKRTLSGAPSTPELTSELSVFARAPDAIRIIPRLPVWAELVGFRGTQNCVAPGLQPQAPRVVTLYYAQPITSIRTNTYERLRTIWLVVTDPHPRVNLR